jgi:hypothetical protein
MCCCRVNTKIIFALAKDRAATLETVYGMQYVRVIMIPTREILYTLEEMQLSA